MPDAFEALAHPTRRRILEILKGGPQTAGEIAEGFDVSKPTMSVHYAKLREAGLIRAEARGTSIVYSINLSALEEVVMGFMTRLGVGDIGEARCDTASRSSSPS